MPLRSTGLASLALLASLATGPAFAQTTPPANPAPTAPPANPPVPPNAETPPGGVPRGVLPAPRGIDPEMVEHPAPSAGTMPVITPPGTAR